MKTKILCLITVLSIISLISNTASAAVKDKDNGVVVSEAANFSKIEVRGNVELYLTDGSANNVKVYNNYYGESALVQNQSGTLRISSYSKDRLVVYITVADLRAITAYDNAVVKSFKGLSAINLDVNLYNNATAQLNINAFQANINVNDRAVANLQGNVNECGLNVAQSSTVNSANLVAEHLSKKVTGKNMVIVKDNQEMAII